MNPAIITLLKSHFSARLRRIRNSFSSPRRLMLSLATVLLTCVWLGQTIFSVLLRDPYEPVSFRNWVSLGLMGYFAWHIVRVAFKRPDEAIEWSPEEQALVVDGPFQRTEILIYRVFVIFTSTLPKALLTWFVLWPDLGWSSPFGILLALVFLEFFRMTMDLSSHCISDRSYRIYRITVASIIVVGAVVVWNGATGLTPGAMARQLQALRWTAPIQVLEAPFHVAATVFSGHGSVSQLLFGLAGMMCVVTGIAALVRWLDEVHQRCLITSEQQQTIKVVSKQVTESTATGSLPRLPLAGFFGPLAWRQSKRAKRYWGSLAVAMGIPAVLSAMPLFTMANSTIAFVAVVCAMLFYTFVLLPEAIKFDFRLDSDHICKLKMLPMTSNRIVLGQLFTPIALACGFQVAMIVFAAVVRNVPISLVAGALGLVIPMTVLFVAIDNLIFLLYPHRPTQEGFEAFLRTVLKFTGKSLLLVVAGGMLVLWAPIAALSAAAIDRAISPQGIFFIGVCAGVATMAWMSVRIVVRAYDRFDVSLDSVG